MSESAELVGKTLLVGITYLDENGEVLDQQQLHGVIEAAGELIRLRTPAGEIVELPPEIEPAGPGEYRVRATGEVVVDPDYLATWTVSQPAADDRG
jgi:hypothetical protein